MKNNFQNVSALVEIMNDVSKFKDVVKAFVVLSLVRKFKNCIQQKGVYSSRREYVSKSSIAGNPTSSITMTYSTSMMSISLKKNSQPFKLNTFRTLIHTGLALPGSILLIFAFSEISRAI